MMEVKRPMTECYVAFLDLMGVRTLATKAAGDSAVCGSIVSALKETKNTSSFVRETRDIASGSTRKWSLQVQAFSDCVVMFIPTESKMLPWLLASIRRLHDRLLRLNVPVRGGITIGEMYWDTAWDQEVASEAENSTPVAFGPGLVAAYDLENDTSVYPRILISTALYDYVDQHHKTGSIFPLGNGRLLNFFRQDADGLYHFDVLHAEMNRKDVIKQTKSTDGEGRHVMLNEFDETPYPDYLEIVRQFVESGRAAVSGEKLEAKYEKLEAKYMWLGTYCNEKAKGANGKLIHWFEDLVPEGAIKMTVKDTDRLRRFRDRLRYDRELYARTAADS